MDNALQLVCIEPGAVRAADINDDPGAVREVQAVHQLVALRAADVVHRPKCGGPTGWLRTAERSGLLLCVAADVLERSGA